MASRISPYVDNTGLVFAYDLANVQRSYSGQPATNLITSGLPGYFGSGGETLYQQSLLGLTSDSGVFQRNYVTNPALADSGTYNNNGGLYKNFTTSALNAATRYIQISFDFYMITRYRTFGSSGIGLNGYIGITNADSTSDAYGWDTRYCNGTGDDWSNDQAYVGRWQKVSLIAALRGDKNPASINAMYIYYDRFTQGEGIFTNFIITEHTTLPTGPVRYTAGTRSVTQGLKDLTGRSTIDLTNVSFDANAQMTFDGTNDAISVTTPSGFSGSGTWTLNTWFKINGAPSSTAYMNVILDMNPTGGSANMICVNWSDMRLQYRSRPVGGSYTDINGSILTQGVWYNATVVKNGTSDTKLYLNGVQDGGTYSGDLPAGNQSTFNIGRWTDGTVFANATIPTISIYNRALSASEVQQNFNAIKGRYGL